MTGPVNTKMLSASEQTLRRWMKEPSFLEAYRDARRECLRDSTARLQQAAGEAVQTLVKVMRDRKATASSKISAARTVLEFAYRASENDVESELRTMEERLESTMRLLVERGDLPGDDGSGRLRA